MNKKYHKFHLTDLPSDKFCVLLKGNVQRELIESAADEISNRSYGKYKDLAIYLQQKCKSFSKINAESIWDRYIFLWKSNRMFIPIDCLLELCKVINKNIEEIENSVKKIKYKNVPNKSAIKFSFVYDENMAAISEAIKTEGHLKKDFLQCRIASQNIELINHFKGLLNKFGVPNLYENLIVESDIPNKNIREIISESKEFNFFIRKLKSKTKIRFVDNFEYNKTKNYKIIFDDNSIIKMKIKIPSNSKIIAKNSFGVCSAMIDLHITNMTFCKLMNILCKVPTGKKSRLIEFSELIFSSPETVQNAVINVIMACESWVEIKSKRIRFFVESKSYSLQLKRLFETFGIHSSIDNRGYISISSRGDLIKFSKNFDFIVKEKNEKLREILSTYKRFPFRHGEGLIKILVLLSGHERLNAYKVAKKLKKHKDTAFLHLNNGIKREFIDKDTSTWPYEYSITENGRKFLGEKNVMSRS